MAPSACDNDPKILSSQLYPTLFIISVGARRGPGKDLDSTKETVGAMSGGISSDRMYSLHPSLRWVGAKTNMDNQQEAVFINCLVPNGTSAWARKLFRLRSDPGHLIIYSSGTRICGGIEGMNEASIPKPLAFSQYPCGLSTPVNARQRVLSFLCAPHECFPIRFALWVNATSNVELKISWKDYSGLP